MKRNRVPQNYDRTAALNAAKHRAVKLLELAAYQAIIKASAGAIGQMSTEMGEMLHEIGVAFIRDDASTRQRLFQELGEAGQRSMLASYGQVVTAREGPASASHYRIGDGRLAGGIMRRALGSADFFTATPLGLEWGNREVLDGAAAQWHRLNFGAGGRAGGGDEDFPVRFGGSGSALSFEDEASPAFSMPAGIWIDPESGGRVGAGDNARGADQFFPVRRTVTDENGNTTSVNARPANTAGRPTGLRPTQGIEGKHFMEAGLKRISNELPKVMDTYAKDLYKGLSRVRKKRQAKDVVSFSSPASLLEIEIP